MNRKMEKLLNKIEKTPTCWNWLGTIRESNGYGRVEFQGRTQTAHRVIYELMIGEIPNGLELDHLCRNKRCVNPAHLEPVTKLENIKRSQEFRKLKSVCKNGHLYDKSNISIIHRNDGTKDRICKKCRNEGAKRFRRNRKSLFII